MLLDQRCFKRERFGFVVRYDDLDVGNLIYKFLGLDAITEFTATAGLKVRTHTIAQVLSFTDVNDFSRSVLVQIDAGRARDFFELLFESHFWYLKFILALYVEV